MSLFLASFLFVEALVIGLLAKSPSLPVTTSFLTKDNLASAALGHDVWAPATQHLFDVKISCLVIASLLVPAACYLIQATWKRKNYEAKLRKGINTFHWLSYIIGGGIAMGVIALLNGIYDVSTLLAIFTCVEVFGLFGLLAESRKELSNHPRLAGKLAFVALITPLLIITFYLLGAKMYGSTLPGYVLALDLSLIVVLAVKATIMIMTLRKKGRWGDNLEVAKTYVVLGFLASSGLAWQVFFGTLR